MGAAVLFAYFNFYMSEAQKEKRLALKTEIEQRRAAIQEQQRRQRQLEQERQEELRQRTELTKTLIKNDSKLLNNAFQLREEVYRAIKQAEKLSSLEKQDITDKVTLMPRQIMQLFYKILEVRRVLKTLDSTNGETSSQKLSRFIMRKSGDKPYQKELQEVEAKYFNEIENLLNVIRNIPVQILNLDMVGSARTISRLSNDLDEANSRIKDVISTYTEQVAQLQNDV